MRRFLLSLIAFFAYCFGIDAFFYWLNRRAKRIVTFHNVIPKALLAKEDENPICFSDETFGRIVDEIGNRYGFSTDLADVTTCTLTFDDGYANQLEVAGRILRQRSIPAVLFLARDLLDAKSPLAVEQCSAWADKVPLDVAERGFHRHFATRVELWQQSVRPLFAGDGANRGRTALKRLDAIWPMENAFATFRTEYRRLRFTGITSGQMEEFRRAGWVFGHHTYSHFPVKDLSDEDAHAEMLPPPGMEDVVFSFPYGDVGSVSARDVRLAERIGYPYAVSNWVEHTALDGDYFLPRFMIATENRFMIHFVLSGLKYFLKYRRLLPRLAHR